MQQTMRCCRVFAILLAFCLVLSGCGGKTNNWEKLYKSTGDRLVAQGTPTVGSVKGEWLVIGLAGSNRLSDATAAAYLKNVENHILSIKSNRLHPVKSTENARLILGITAAGGNPADIDGYNLLLGLADMDYIQKQGNNGPIWALIAFDCGNYQLPQGSNVSREKLVNYILSLQCSDGGWGFYKDASDIDITAMALQALAPYNEKESVKTAVEKALCYISANQTANGGFESYGEENCESSAQVVVALCSLGIDPQKEPRFIKNNHSVIDALCSFYTQKGGFCHQKDTIQTDDMATEQAYYALTAYSRYKSNLSSLYTMR